MYILLTNHKVKMAGYWPSSICVFMDRDEVEVHIKTQKQKNQGQYPAILTELAWSIKDLLYGIRSTEKKYLRTCLFLSTENAKVMAHALIKI